jgi:cytochrome P450
LTWLYLADIISGGTDTVSVTLSWSVVIMCHHPEVQKKVSAEIDKFVRVHNRVPIFDEREELPFCISVIKECMRYKPTDPFGLPHSVEEDG